MALSTKKYLWWIAAAVFVLGGPFMGTIAYRLADRLEHERVSALCAEYFSDRAGVLTREMHEITDELRHLRSLFLSSQYVTRDEFRAFTSEVPARHPGILAMEWVPRILRRERERHVQQARAQGLSGYEITAVGPNGSLAVAPVKDEYYPVFYAEPSGPNHGVLGFDISSENTRLSALVWANLTREPSLSDPIDLVPDPDPSKGFLVLLPIYRAAAPVPAAASDRPDGLVLLIVRARDIFGQMTGARRASDAPDLRFELTDESVDGKPVVIAASAQGGGEPALSGWSYGESIAVGGQRWRLTGHPTAAYISKHVTREPLVLGAGVFLLWELVGGFALGVVRQARDAAVRRQTRVFETALRNLTEGVVVADAKGRLILFNDAAEAILGIGRRDVPMRDWSTTWGCFDPETQAQVPTERLPLARALQGEEVQSEVLIRNAEVPAGRWATVSGTPLRDEDGTLEGGVITVRDVTAARQAEAQLRASFKQLEDLRSAVEQTADTIIITDLHGVIEYVNPAFESTTGYSRAEALGRTPRILKSGKHPAEFYDHLWSTISAGEVFRGAPINRKKGGELYHAEQTITPIKDPDGHIVHFVSVIKDVTDRIKIQQQEIEMRYAAEVQQKLYPLEAPRLDGFDIAGATFPTLATCGDYFDYLPLRSGKLDLVIADVSGHGLGPALIMAETRAYLRFLSGSCEDPGEALNAINDELCADLEDNRYVALILARLDPVSRRLAYVNAGHTAAYHLSHAGAIKAALESCGPPLGVLTCQRYQSACTPTIEPGDIVVFLTDGITETEDVSGEFFGTDAALDVVRKLPRRDRRPDRAAPRSGHPGIRAGRAASGRCHRGRL